MEYTHNLKIILLDNNNNSIIEDKVILNEIKKILSKNHTHKIEWNGRLLDITIKWDKIILNEINQILMGDLFSLPIYDFDSIILHHTQETISKIDCKYIVKFYISRIICNKIMNKDTIGFIK
jgi:hypothetical protein